jgi:hypothetical protein
LPFSFSVERRIIAFSVALCLRLQVLLHLQLVHLPEELLEQFATLRADALFQLIHNFFGRERFSRMNSHSAGHRRARKQGDCWHADITP